jgi:primosomal protein N' (replication factor Y)
MDEAHDSAYKQEQAPYYQTSRVAARLGFLHSARFVMGTATPLIGDYYMFNEKALPIIRLTKLATTQDASQPAHEVTTEIIDHRNKDAFSRSPWLANNLLNAMQGALERGEQSLLFLNRRGSARLVLCENCGWQAVCPHCDVPLTYHQDQYIMRCHSCDFSGAVPSSCPVCGASELIFRSIGTKALVDVVQKLFPDARVARFDRDTAKLDRLQHQFESLQTGEIDIVIGTQAIAKGFDLPKLAVVGVVQADSGLQLPDFNASERTFQLLSQVSGRIGRGHRAGKLFVQTFDPDSQLIADALSKNYQNFYKRELLERRTFRFPPYYFLMKVTSARASSKSAYQAADKVANTLRERTDIIVEGPTPRYIEKIAGKYAWHVIIKSTRRSTLLEIISRLPAGTTYDIDPSDLL